MRRVFGCICVLIILGSPSLSGAQSDSFTVRLSLGSDTESPTTPNPLSVTPIASTQIDVTWGTSTDNAGVIGYQLFRDAVQIATTTLTTFSDTGLNASTAYAYYVTAFDSSGNISSSSVTRATTTFAEVPPVVATSTQESADVSIARLQLTSFDITPSTNGAKFTFGTNLPTRFILRYGTTSVYDDGVIEGPVFKRSHTTSLFPLDPGTNYVYELNGFDRFGNEVVLSSGSFDTVNLPDTTAPANVSNFSATPFGADTFLSWRAPADDDFVFVRVVRNHLFYPANDSDGFLVYEGSASSFTDQGGLLEYDTQYYTIFAYDSSNNSSSGAVATATTQPAQESDLIVSEESAGEPESDLDANVDEGGATSTADQTVLYAGSVQIVQADTNQTLADRFIVLDSRLPYEMFVPVEAVPQNLKTIVATIVNPSNQRLQDKYLLKINQEQTGYSARVSAPMVIGDSRITIEMIDFSLGTTRKIEQTVSFVTSVEPAPPLTATLSRYDVWPFILQGGVISFLLFLLYVMYIIRRPALT